jgi:glutamate decarboxylase
MTAALDHYGYKGAVVIASNHIHYSVEKAVSMLGLGARSLIKVPVDKQYRMDTKALRRAVASCLADRQKILAIIGIAGTTDCGTIDPLSEIAEVAQEHKIHFHVDAAWGAPLLFSGRHRHLLHGIDQADSLTADGHKQMYLPMGSSMLLLRNPQTADVIEKETRYILHEGSGDLGKRSLEGSRGGTALFTHAALNIIGAAGYEFLIEENIRKARAMAELIKRRPEFELITEPETNILLYRYLPIESRGLSARGALTAEDNLKINKLNEKLQKAQHEAGRTFVSRTTVENCRATNGNSAPLVVLRAVIANPFTNEEDMKVVLEDQISIAAELRSAGAANAHV